MSIMIMSRLFKMNLGGCNRKLLAVRLADFADDDGRGIYPGVRRLSAETELSERTIQRILAEFVQEGILVVVQEATGRPGMATRYDFDLTRLFAYTPRASSTSTGDSVSPVQDSGRGDTEGERGDSGDRDGCHGDTRTVIEPLEPPSGRASEGEGSSKRIERKEAESEFVKWMAAHEYGDVDFARNAWHALTAEQRAECIRRSPEYIRQTPRSKRPAAATYLKNRHWLDVPEPLADSERVALHNVFSRAWMAQRLSELLKPMASAWPPITIFQRQQAARDPEFAARLERERMARYGWPKVNALDDLKQVAVAPALVAISEGFGKVHRDSELAARWREAHEQRGWPWVPEADHEWLYFPAGEPDDAIAGFERAARSDKARVNDDAA